MEEKERMTLKQLYDNGIFTAVQIARISGANYRAVNRYVKGDDIAPYKVRKAVEEGLKKFSEELANIIIVEVEDDRLE